MHRLQAILIPVRPTRCVGRTRGSRGAGRCGAFTLIELLIVVMILGILASVVVPQFSDASRTSRENMLRDELRYLRTQIEVYAAQHYDVPPGYPDGDRTKTPTEAAFLAQMTHYSSTNGVTSETRGAAYPHGPYFRRMPENPVNNLANVRIVGDGEAMPAPTGTDHGWIYQPQSRRIVVNLVGEDLSGMSFSEY